MAHMMRKVAPHAQACIWSPGIASTDEMLMRFRASKLTTLMMAPTHLQGRGGHTNGQW